jgi:hypothetical protein
MGRDIKGFMLQPVGPFKVVEMEDIMKNLLTIAAGLMLVGCVDSSKDSATGPGETVEPTFAVTWGGSSVDLAITDGDGSYFFGMAETGSTCSANPDDCWTGEDCVFGFSDYAYCHPAAATGVSLTYGGAFDAVNEGSDTVFPDNSFDGSVTYYIEYTDGSCGVFGQDVSYYASQNCTQL